MHSWSSGRDCTEKFECNGTGTCTPYETSGKGGKGCTAGTSVGTFVNTLLGPAAKRAVTAASACSEAQCGGHGRCFACPEPFDDPTGFAKCKCDCDDFHAGPTCGTQPSPTPPAPPACPGGSLVACMEVCPSSPVIAYKDCVDECVKRCTVVTTAARLSVDQ